LRKLFKKAIKELKKTHYLSLFKRFFIIFHQFWRFLSGGLKISGKISCNTE